MDDGEVTQNRRSRRSKLLMAATLAHAGGTSPVKLRELSAEGALVEGDHGLTAGADIVLHKNDLSVAGRIAWAEGRRAGISFAMGLDPETVLRHVPPPTAQCEPMDKKRPGFRGALSLAERRLGESLWGGPLPSIER